MTKNFTVQNCDFQYIRDDAGSCHVDAGVSLAGRKVRFLNNHLFQGFEVKFLGGGDVLVDGCTMELMGPCAVYFGLDPTTLEGNTQTQTGYTISNNTIKYTMRTDALFGTGRIRAVEVYAPGLNSSVNITGNTFICLNASTSLAALYPTYPNQFFDKTGFIASPGVIPEDGCIRFYCKNANSTLDNIVSTSNVFTGSWSYQVLRSTA